MFFSVLKRSFLIVLLVTLFVITITNSVKAATVDLNEAFQGETTFDLDTEIVLPDEPTILSGRGERGAEITVTAFSGNHTLFSTSTTVDAQGNWQVSLPRFEGEFPNRLNIHSSVEVSLMKVVETAGVTTSIATSGFVLAQLIIDRVLRGLQALGLLGRKKTRGYVFDVLSKKPVPFALLTITNTSKTLKETVVSGVDGFFQTVALPPGEYTIDVAHPDFIFPSKLKKPSYATPLSFYQGEKLYMEDETKLDICFIPLQPKATKVVFNSHWLNFRVLREVLGRLAHILTVPMGILSVILLFFYPTFLNFAVCSFYFILFLYHQLHRARTKLLKGRVSAESGARLADVIVRVFNPKSNALIQVTLTNEKGEFMTRLPKGGYKVTLTKDKLISEEETKMSFQQVDLEKDKRDLKYKMVPLPIYELKDLMASLAVVKKVK